MLPVILLGVTATTFGRPVTTLCLVGVEFLNEVRNNSICHYQTIFYISGRSPPLQFRIKNLQVS